MKKSRLQWTVKKFIKLHESGQISFDYPIQRPYDQWDLSQKSLLIHSLAHDFPASNLFTIAEKELIDEKEVLVYKILDGKQRLTTIRNFIQNNFALSNDIPKFELEGEIYDLANKTFKELPGDIQDEILDYSLDAFKFDEITDDEIEEVFFRLNNGTALTKQQKAKAKMGSKGALRLQSLLNHNLMNVNAKFTDNQIKKSENEVALVQTMMLIDSNYDLGTFGTQDVFEYTVNAYDGKEEVFTKIEEAMNYLHDILKDSIEKTLLKKVHFPFVLYAANEALKNNISTHTFGFFIDDFTEKLNDKENKETWLYKIGGGAGASKADKVAMRLTAVNTELEKLYADIEKEKQEEKRQLEEIKKSKKKNSENETAEFKNQKNKIENFENQMEISEFENPEINEVKDKNI